MRMERIKNLDFIVDMFLDNDGVSTLNKLVVAVAGVVNENHENIEILQEFLKKEATEAIYLEENIKSIPISQTCENYYEDIVKHYSDKEFFEQFKMKKSTVHALIELLKIYVKPGGIVPLDKKVHVFLWVLTSGSSYHAVGELFGLHKSSVGYIFHEISTWLAKEKSKLINWPSTEEQHLTRVKVNSRFNFPNCVGFLDACQFRVGSKRTKKENPNIVLLQAVCDDTLRFINIHVGEIGTNKKSKLLKDSEVIHELKNKVDFDNHVLGSHEYKLRIDLITPFTSDEVLTSEEMKFNETHLKAHSYIAYAFELLKERFRKLNHMDINKLEAVETLICAACVLHNFILLHEGSAFVKEEVVICDDGVVIDPSIVKTAIEKRQFLCNYINYIDEI